MLCRGYGLTIDTAFDLPGATPCFESSIAVDLVIAEDDAALPNPEATLGAYSRSGDRLGLTVPNVARYRLDGPGRMTIARDPQASSVDVSELLIASALPMALWRRGGTLLHASGVELDGGIVAIAGASGSGKSTLARLLVEQGGWLAGDDSVWLQTGEGETSAVGLTGGWFLGQGTGRRFELLTPERQATATRLKAIVALDPAAPAGLRRLDSMAAVQALLRHRHRPNIPALLGRDGDVLRQCAAIARTLPVYTLGLVEGQSATAVEVIAGLK